MFASGVLGLWCPVHTCTGQVEQRLAPEEFPILPWGWTGGDKQVFEDIKACGFNLAGFVTPERLDLVAETGLKCIVFSPDIHVQDAVVQLDNAEVTKRVEAITHRVGNHPAVFGYYLRDEPTTVLFPALTRWSAAFRNTAPNAKPYINLFPNYASVSQLGVKTYEEYVESFVTTVKPTFISYDNYSLMDDGSLRDGYYPNLEVIRAAGLRHNLPFWNIVLANAHFHYAEPTPAGLRFQVYTTLAYGARGISYFTYFAPQVGNYRLAPIDQFGHKTPTWEMLRDVNLQIHRLGPIYTRLKSVNVFHHPDVPAGCRDIKSSKFVDEVSGGQFVVGEFDGPDARPYVMVVNKDLRKSVSFGIKFKSAGNIAMVSPYSGAVLGWQGENNWLAAGQGMLLTLSK